MTDRWPHGDPRDVARAILADPRFQLHPAPPAAPSWLDILGDWIAGVVRRLLHAVDHTLGSGNPLETIAGYGIVAATLALLAYGVFLLVRSLARSRRPAGGKAARVAAPTNAPRGSADLYAAACAAARAGDYRDAAALLFAAAARALDERGRLPYDPARTPGEYRRLVRDPAFDALAHDAVVALFAPTDPSDGLFERMRTSYDRCFAAPAARVR